jgi:hypothetical protein
MLMSFTVRWSVVGSGGCGRGLAVGVATATIAADGRDLRRDGVTSAAVEAAAVVAGRWVLGADGSSRPARARTASPTSSIATVTSRRAVSRMLPPVCAATVQPPLPTDDAGGWKVHLRCGSGQDHGRQA